MQAAGAGNDFDERLEKSKLDFRWEMLQKIDATVEGISTAIEKGARKRSSGEQAVESRKEVLAGTARRLDEIRDRLVRIRSLAGSATGVCSQGIDIGSIGRGKSNI